MAVSMLVCSFLDAIDAHTFKTQLRLHEARGAPLRDPPAEEPPVAQARAEPPRAEAPREHVMDAAAAAALRAEQEDARVWIESDVVHGAASVGALGHGMGAPPTLWPMF